MIKTFKFSSKFNWICKKSSQWNYLKRINFSTSYVRNNSDSVQLSYATYDTPESSAAPVVIMHGLLGSKNNWNTLAKAMNEQTSRRIITVDARNHGDSPHSSKMTYPSMAEDIKHLLELLKIKEAILIGHSMGGAAMMSTALNYPNIVEKLLVVDMSPVKTSPSLHQMTEIISAMMSIKFENINTLSEARKRTDELLAKTIESQSLRQFLLMNIVEKNPREFKWRVNLPIIAENFSNHIAVFPEVISKLPNQTFDGPTMFLAGSESDYIKENDHGDIEKIFSNTQIKYIQGAGHWVQSEKPAEFLEAATNFINH